MQIRPARDADFAATCRIHMAGRQHAYRGWIDDRVLDGTPLEEWAELRASSLVRQRGLRTWVAEKDGRVVAFADTAAATDDDLPPAAGEVRLLYVDPAEIERGLAANCSKTPWPTSGSADTARWYCGRLRGTRAPAASTNAPAGSTMAGCAHGSGRDGRFRARFVTGTANADRARC